MAIRLVDIGALYTCLVGPAKRTSPRGLCEQRATSRHLPHVEHPVAKSSATPEALGRRIQGTAAHGRNKRGGAEPDAPLSAGKSVYNSETL